MKSYEITIFAMKSHEIPLNHPIPYKSLNPNGWVPATGPQYFGPQDIVQILAERLVHTETGRQLTPVATESALKSIGFSVCLGRCRRVQHGSNHQS